MPREVISEKIKRIDTFHTFTLAWFYLVFPKFDLYAGFRKTLYEGIPRRFKLTNYTQKIVGMYVSIYSSLKYCRSSLRLIKSDPPISLLQLFFVCVSGSCTRGYISRKCAERSPIDPIEKTTLTRITHSLSQVEGSLSILVNTILGVQAHTLYTLHLLYSIVPHSFFIYSFCNSLNTIWIIKTRFDS